VAVLAAIGEGLVELERDGDADRLALAAGGDAANILVMASRLGATTRLAGRVGADPLGAWLLAFWADRGVDVAHVRSDPDAPTGLYLNAPDSGGGHRFVYWRRGSAGSRLAAADLDDGLFADLDMLVVTGITLAVSPSSASAGACAVRRAREAGARVACVLNHRPALAGDPDALAALARTADVVIGSSEDAAAVFGESDPVAVAYALPDVHEVVLTAGGGPAVAVVDRVAIEQRVPAVPVVNAGGAGDAFAGAYLARRLSGESPAQALTWGVAASAQSVRRRGCASSYPTMAEAAAVVAALA
jgi:2-dehydro-3-deoxygluconokinase